MKSFIFLFCSMVFSLTPTSEVFSQNTKIKIDADKVLTVDQVFDLIMDQTQYTFIYQVDMFKDLPKVNLKKGNIYINSLLQKTLSKGEFQVQLVANSNNVLITERAALNNTQGILVTGTITDKNGMSIPGLSVYLTKDTSGAETNIISGTTSDFDGVFRLTATPGDILVVTGIGYKKAQQNILAGKTTYNFILQEDLNQLEEVVVTGYQKISRERSTGAFNVIGKDQIKNNVTQSIGSVLQGIAPNVQIVEDADGNIDINNVVVRGVGSINSSTAPLVVVDGFPIQGGFDTINPNDVASVTILKDAAAASIWGARAGNGVIVVITKKAQEGSKLKVSFSTFVKLRSKVDLDYNFTGANSATTLDFESTIWTPGGFGVVGSMSNNPPPQTVYDRGIAQVAYGHGAQAYYDAYHGNITQAELNSKINRLRGTNTLDDASKYLLTSPINQQYNLAISTSTEKSNTRVSAVYNDNVNAFINDTSNQLLININNQYKIGDWITFNLNGMVDNSKFTNALEGSAPYGSTGARRVGLQTLGNMAPYESLIDANGAYSSVASISYNSKYLDVMGNTLTNLPYDEITYNPLRDARENLQEFKNTNYRISTGLEIDIVDGLQFKPSFQYENFKTTANTTYGANSFFSKMEVINSSSIEDYDPANAAIGRTRINPGAILDYDSKETISTTFRSLLTYDKIFGKHAVSALAGFERISSTTKGATRARTYGFNKDNNTFDLPENTPWSPVWDYDTKYIGRERAYGQYDSRFLSYFGNLSYTYDRKYTVSGSARSDGANFIVEDKSQRYNPMWSLGFSWNAKNESFLEDVDAINKLSFRVTNGENGNLVGSEATKPTITIYSTPNANTGLFSGYLDGLGNPDLRWERINTLNFGTDFNLFDSKLYGSIDVYNKHSKLLIASVDVPSTTGQSSARYNVGEMVNKGVEFNLFSDIKFSDNAFLTTNLVYGHNNSETTSLADLFIHPRSLVSFPYIEGKPYQPIYAFEYGGMQTIPSQPVPYPTINGQNGVTYGMDENIGINGEDGREVLKYMGTKVAPTVVGWNNTFRFKQFTLSTRMLGKFGHKFVRTTFEYPSFRTGGLYHEDLEGLMAGNHDAMGLPQLTTQYEFYNYRWGWYVPQLDSLVEDAAHIRLQQIYLSYDMSRDVLSKIGISNLRLFAQAENLGNIWVANDFKIDPEYNRGVARAPEKTFSVGINVEF
ncbi:SusC/RagA family TonB-linked outer membrane protein [Pseudotamlana haliotis]|nr:SusC/RagA family TonB-linked outer membrane protein [Tamlana haliotis]